MQGLAGPGASAGLRGRPALGAELWFPRTAPPGQEASQALSRQLRRRRSIEDGAGTTGDARAPPCGFPGAAGARSPASTTAARPHSPGGWVRSPGAGERPLEVWRGSPCVLLPLCPAALRLLAGASPVPPSSCGPSCLLGDSLQLRATRVQVPSTPSLPQSHLEPPPHGVTWGQGAPVP